jgi:hypothetical protein
MAGGRRARRDSSARLTWGVSLLTLSIALALGWTQRTHTTNSTNSIIVLAVVLFGVACFLLGSIIPRFRRPEIQITVSDGSQGYDGLFWREIIPSDEDAVHVNPTHPDKTKVEVWMTLIRLNEFRGRWAERVRVEVVQIEPMPPANASIQCLTWYHAAKVLSLDMVPLGEEWAILQTAFIDKERPGHWAHSGLSDHDPFTCILSVSWDGQLINAVRLKVSGWKTFVKGDPVPLPGYAKVEILDYPQLRYVHRLNKNKTLAYRTKIESPYPGYCI